jgi:hypothetical protein
MKPNEEASPKFRPTQTKPRELSEKLQEWMNEETRNPSLEGALSKRMRMK